MSREEIYKLVEQYTHEYLDNLEGKKLDPTLSMVELGASSLDVVEIVSVCLRDLQLNIPKAELISLKNINELVDTLHRYKTKPVSLDSEDKRPDGSNAENFNLLELLAEAKDLPFLERANYFAQYIQKATSELPELSSLYMRPVLTETDRQVTVFDPNSGQQKKMLMFGSNNYLGLANHPHVHERVRQAIEQYGVGLGGPPLLTGYTKLHNELENKLAEHKQTESCLLFSSGYTANVGLVSTLAGGGNATVVVDEDHHASVFDGLKLAGGVPFRCFLHNNAADLEKLLAAATHKDKFVAVEGVYSMEGDIAPLDEIVPVCKKYGAILMVDDAHATGVIGKNGHGSAEYCGVAGQVDVQMGTFSKALAVTGGYVAASKAIVDYLRFYTRSYLFSTSLPPVTVAAVLGGLEVIENEPDRLQRLHDNVAYTVAALRKNGLPAQDKGTGLIILRVPETMDIRKAGYYLHQAGIFTNSIEYPAVPLNKQRFRISVMANHLKEDLDYLVELLADVWVRFGGVQI